MHSFPYKWEYAIFSLIAPSSIASLLILVTWKIIYSTFGPIFSSLYFKYNVFELELISSIITSITSFLKFVYLIYLFFKSKISFIVSTFNLTTFKEFDLKYSYNFKVCLYLKFTISIKSYIKKFFLRFIKYSPISSLKLINIFFEYLSNLKSFLISPTSLKLSFSSNVIYILANLFKDFFVSLYKCFSFIFKCLISSVVIS